MEKQAATPKPKRTPVNAHKYGEYFHPGPRLRKKLEEQGRVDLESFLEGLA